MADSGHSTATLRLTMGTLRIAHPITVPTASVPAAEIVPALQGLVNAAVEAAEAGQTVSFRNRRGAAGREGWLVSARAAHGLEPQPSAQGQAEAGAGVGAAIPAWLLGCGWQKGLRLHPDSFCAARALAHSRLVAKPLECAAARPRLRSRVIKVGGAARGGTAPPRHRNPEA